MNQRIVQWDPATGLPVITTAPLITRAQLQDLYAAAAAEAFDCPDPLDPDHHYHGLPLAEVMVRKEVLHAARTGDTETVMDRLMGRPKQESLNVKVTTTYEDMLREIERKTSSARSLPAVYTVEATASRHGGDNDDDGAEDPLE